jgi:hypothetical protein
VSDDEKVISSLTNQVIELTQRLELLAMRVDVLDAHAPDDASELEPA